MTRPSALPRRQPAREPDLAAASAPMSAGGALVRHVVVALASALLVIAFWVTRLDWDVEMRTWRAFGDASIVLLFVTLLIGPLSRLWRPARRAIVWRRELGVWFLVTALVHTVLILRGWVMWDLGRLMGYEFIPELDRTVRLEPGFGLANILGLVALAWAVVLGLTSSNRAVRFLGAPAWKWVHQGAHVIFYLVVLHAAYFLLIHYTPSFHRTPPPPNWFAWPLLVMGVAVAAVQWLAWVATVRRRIAARAAVTREP